MNAAIEDRLRRHYDDRTRDLPAHGPGLDDVVMPRIHAPRTAPRPNRTVRVSLVVGSIAALVALGVLLVNRPADDDRDVGASGPQPSVDAPNSSVRQMEELQPVEVLPESDDVSNTPVTAAANAPVDWYRMQPDLDIAWHQDPANESPSMLCWRTPAGSDCVEDGPSGPLPLIVPTAGGQTLVITVDPGGQSFVQVQYASGELVSAVIDTDDQIEWGVVRIEVPAGDSIVSVGDASNVANEAVEVSGETLPPAIGLSETPITLVAGSELSYWRWFPDLDISERATAEGTELCWRTPAGTGCIDDSFISPEVGIIPTDSGAILLARQALVAIEPPPTDPLAAKFELGPPLTSITATLSDGSTVAVEVNLGKEFGVGYARINLEDGLSVLSATSS